MVDILEEVRIVGIGASAGGLEALRDLMASLPESDVFSYVIAQHISPTHVSMLKNLLAPLTTLKVQEFADRQRPEAGVVYITPPNSDVVLYNGFLCLSEPMQPIGPKPSVNRFFLSLADQMGEKAIGIILSGTGSDGASGIRAIRVAGGITIVQDPDTAKYDGMPKSAIHTGSVDLILSPAKIGPTLERLLSNPKDMPFAHDEDDGTDEYVQISNIVRHNTAFKLSDYKSGTVKRRISRRMNIIGVSTLPEYINHLKHHKEESQMLMRDTFISVTSFFRDQDAFFGLERVIGEIVKTHQDRNVIRCWVPACASGEEVYTIAMLFEEALKNQKKPSIQYMIFASDLDEDAIERARAGLYPISELEAVPRGMRDIYMEVAGDHCRVIKSIRNRVVFARQNVIEDPPFARLDLISCRNLLIYFNPPVQKRVFEVFHYSLNQGGHLFLGKSETVDQNSGLFRPVDTRLRIYQRQEGVSHYALPLTQGVPRVQAGRAEVVSTRSGSADIISIRTLEQLTERYAPPSLVIDETENVLHFQGDLKAFLSFPKGRADMYLFDLVHPMLRAELRALVHRCRKDPQLVRGSNFSMEIGGQEKVVTVVLSPLEIGQRSHLLVTFETASTQDGKFTIASLRTDDRDNLIISELEHELANTRTHLNIVVNELETANEELQSLNEELQSTNEELQSTNEELQTSNEELQSTNEELLTVNEEMQSKSAEVEVLAQSLTNVKQSLTFPLIVVDDKLRVTHINDASAAIVLVDGPLVRGSLGNAQWRVDIPGLTSHVRGVIQTGQIYQTVVETSWETIYQLSIMPFRISRGDVAGAVLVFEDVTEQKRSEAEVRSLYEKTPAMLHTIDAQGNVVNVSDLWLERLGYQRSEVIGRSVFGFFKPGAEQRALTEVFPRFKQVGFIKREPFDFQSKSGESVAVEISSVAIRNSYGDFMGGLTILEEVTLRNMALDNLREQKIFLDEVLETLPYGIAVFDKERALRLHNSKYGQVLRLPSEMMASKSLLFSDLIKFLYDRGDYGFKLSLDQVIEQFVAKMENRTPLTSQRKQFDGSYIEFRAIPISRGWTSLTYLDITERILSEEKAKGNHALLLAAVDSVDEAFVMYDDEDRLVYCNEKYKALHRGSEQYIVLGETFQNLVRKAAMDGVYMDATAEHIEEFLAQRALAHSTGAFDMILHLNNGKVLRSVDRRMPNGYIAGFRIDITEYVRATELAKEASISKGQFLANMSHEIRTPMNGILGMLDLLQRTELTPRQIDYTNKIEAASKSLLGLINDILDFSKVEAGKTTLECEPFSLEKFLLNISVILSASLSNKNIEILFDLDPKLPSVLCGDALRLQQILINLGGNAVKFTAQGQVVIGMHVLQTLSERVRINFSIEDTGIGIPVEQHARIFTGFSQAEASTTRRFGGTGLGLAISKRLVELMGGNLQLASEVGVGSTFSFAIDLPLVVDVPIELAPVQRTGMPQQTVLVIDDNPIAANLVVRLAQSLGWSAEAAGSGEQGLAMFRSALHSSAGGTGAGFAYTAICVDWNMPQMDGWATTQALRQLAQQAGCAQPMIIMLSANGRELLSQRSEQEQQLLNGFLVKPFTASMLFDALFNAGSSNNGLRRLTGGRSSKRQLTGMRILVVEDNLINQQVAEELLTAEGAIVSLAANGQLGVDAVRAALPQFDVVLMDVQMPVLDGYAATALIRQDPRFKDLPIIAMTANAMSSDREACLNAGMNEHIGKPFQMKKLTSQLIRITGFVAPSAIVAT